MIWKHNLDKILGDLLEQRKEKTMMKMTPIKAVAECSKLKKSGKFAISIN